MSYFSQVVCLDLMMLDNLVPLDLAVGDLLRLLEVIVLLLLGVEALNLMVLQSEGVASDLRQVVNEANHCLGAIRVELIVVSSLDLRPLIHTFLFGLLVRVLSYAVFYVVAEICDESHAVLELNIECLIVNGGPLTVDGLGLTVALAASLAEDGFGLVAFNEVDLVSVVRGELEFVAFVHQLNLVWHRVCTHFLRVKQVDVTLVGADVEIPNTVQLLTNAVHRLVS